MQMQRDSASSAYTFSQSRAASALTFESPYVGIRHNITLTGSLSCRLGMFYYEQLVVLSRVTHQNKWIQSVDHLTNTHRLVAMAKMNKAPFQKPLFLLLFTI